MINDNIGLAINFLEENNLPDEAILGLEVFGQISDGELEDCGNYWILRGYDDCINELKDKYPNSTVSDEIRYRWFHSSQRKSLDFCPRGYEFAEDNLDLNSGYVASILPSSIRSEVLSIIEKYIYRWEEN